MKHRKHQITMIAVKVAGTLLEKKAIALDKGYSKDEF